MAIDATRFPKYALANAAWNARLVRGVKSGDITRKAADELTDLYSGAIRAVLDEVDAMLARCLSITEATTARP